MENIFEEDPLSASIKSWDYEEEIKYNTPTEAIDFEALASGSFEDFEDDFTRELEGLVLKDKRVEEEEFKLVDE